MLVRKDENGMRASKVMQERVRNTPNIKVYWNSETLEVVGEHRVEGVKIKNIKQTKSKQFLLMHFLWLSAMNPTAPFLKTGLTWMKQVILKPFLALPKQI